MPNAMATTVLTKQMTLYGILKSGVGTETRRGSVCSCSNNPLKGDEGSEGREGREGGREGREV